MCGSKTSAGEDEPWQRIKTHRYSVSNYCREDAMNFEGQNISLTDALFVDNITSDLETFRFPNWQFCSNWA